MADIPTPRGERAASIEMLVAAHHAVLYRYALRLTGSPADAEDLTQQTFLTAQTRLDQLRDPQCGRSWLFSILRNAFLGLKRQRREFPAENIESHLDEAASWVRDDLEIDEERLQAALNELSDEFRLVVLMFYFENCSYREIAEKLDLPLGTVMSRLSRAKGHLRSRLSPPNVEQGSHAASGIAARRG